MPLSPEALEAITASGFLHTSGRVKQGEIADKLAERLKTHHIVQTSDDEHVRQRAATIPELTVFAFGADHEDLRYLVAQLTSMDGKVQQRLNNGYVLCAARVRRVIGDVDGQPVMANFTCRFVTDSVDVLKTYLLDPYLSRTDSYFANMFARLKLAVDRVPALQPHVQQLALALPGQVQSDIQKALAPPVATQG